MASVKIPLDTSGQLRDETTELTFVLRPSPHDGVGVFCTHGIRKGTPLRLFPGPASRFIPGADAAADPLLDVFCSRYGFGYRDGSCVSHDFGYMEIGWYLNHSDMPNAIHDGSYRYFAGRDIRAGEEITIDYTTL